jgi:hypothetical protein
MNLASKTWGGADQAYKTLLTKPAITSTIGSGYQLQDGEGTSLPLYFGPEGVGFVNGGGFISSVSTLATSNRTLTFSDASGRISPELYALLAADVTNSTTTPSAVGSFGVTLEASAQYEFDIVIRAQSAATTTGLQFQLTGPSSQTDWIVYDIEYMSGITLASNNIVRQTLNTFATNITATAAPAANTDFMIRIRGMMKTNSTTPAADIGISFQSEIGASQVTIKSGSSIRFRKIN